MERQCLSIQSHVVHGYVGNKCSVFPLQLHGFDVSPINSVQLSTHTGYRSIKGQRLTGDDLATLVEGLEGNGVLDGVTDVLTGYIATPSFLETVAGLVTRIRAHNPGAVYVCDPVLGDDGRLYVGADLIPVYKALLVPHATILTPNQFEAETLTGVAITDVASAVSAMECLHGMGARSVVLTSTALTPAHLIGYRAGEGEQHDSASTAREAGEADGEMLLLASCPSQDVVGGSGAGEGQGTTQHAVFAIVIRKLRASFTGTGDLTSALLLANSRRHPGDFVRAVETTVASLQAVCTATMRRCNEMNAALDAARLLVASQGCMGGDGEASSSGGADAAPAPPSSEEVARALSLIRAAERARGRGGEDAAVQSFKELCLIPCQKELVDPAIPSSLKAVRVRIHSTGC